MDQQWFELRDVRQRYFATAVWIPLRAARVLERVGTRGYVGFREDFFGAATVAVPLEQRGLAETLGWGELGLRDQHRGYERDGVYRPADAVDPLAQGLNGIALVLAQAGTNDDPSEWHLQQDLVIALNLQREADQWLAREEGYEVVARLHRHENRPALLEMRAEHLKDYLCARGMALYISSYRNREAILTDVPTWTWDGPLVQEIVERDRWEGRQTPVHDGGHAVGATIAVTHIGRTHVDTQADVPKIAPDDPARTATWTIAPKGAQSLYLQGELWRTEWVLPAEDSPRVRGDERPSMAFFIIDGAGTRIPGDELPDGRWLWFRPDLIMALAHRRGGTLRWYTRDTTGVRCGPGGYTTFGVNQLGLITAYAEDIRHLPDWQQRIWASHNTGPDGGVAEELLAAQAIGTPARTQAPEALLPDILAGLDDCCTKKFGFRVFREHTQTGTLLRTVHRFRAVDQPSLFALAKDVARLTAEEIDAVALQTIVAPPPKTKWGSLKSLEHVVALTTDPATARALLTPLVGINELRQADAHLPSNDIDEAFGMVGIDQDAPIITQGYQLLGSCVGALQVITDKLGTLPDLVK